ncbi:hypothetical protein WICPIJ_002147 [Wickerhamomyces pijperi]|uniref:Uncharacterized protein n=1 Tax=Wickerhamomyces pijperi TaxID=599730 RepID=A0A9P8Q9J2_WICPI|nr:hypothetical protein WICPIJ_002147 [Wickerhamomyces pijperi]
MKVGLMHMSSNSPTNLSNIRALVNGGEQSSLCLIKMDFRNSPVSAVFQGQLLAVWTVWVVLDFVRAGDLLDHLGEQQLGHVHQVVDIGVSLVELTGGELWVVGHIDTFVSELTADFVDTVHTTDNQLLQEQLWGNTHVHVEVQVVVVGDERLSSGTTGNDVHHWGFNLDELPVVQELSDVGDDLGSGDELVSGGVVDDQVQVSLSVSGFLVLETEMFGW